MQGEHVVVMNGESCTGDAMPSKIRDVGAWCVVLVSACGGATVVSASEEYVEQFCGLSREKLPIGDHDQITLRA